MIRVTLKGLLGRKLRLLLTSLAIVMGVGMVCGTFILTDTINASLQSLFTGLYANSDAVVTGKAVFGGRAGTPAFPAATLGRIQKLPGVAAAAGEVGAQVEIVGADGSVVSRGSAEQIGLSMDAGYERFSAFRLVAGSWPSGPGAVAIDNETATSQHFHLGQSIALIVNGGRELHERVSGIVDYGNLTSIAGDTLAFFNLPTAQTLFAKEGELDQIDIEAKPQVADGVLLSQVASVLPPHTQVRTAQQQAQTEFNDFDSAITVVRYVLLAFGGIALFVGAFVIANTLSITVAQRAREFATLRTIGATSRQVRLAVVLEGLVTGLVASGVGLAVGLGLAALLESLFKAEGVELPLTGLIFALRTVIISLAVGTVVTLLASIWPALRATRVPPIAAVREGAVLPPSRFARFGPALALGVLAVAIALVCAGGFASGLATGLRLLLLGVGVLAVFLGVAMISPTITRPLALALGWPATRIGGAAGSLARANAVRNPARTAATAAALMIGLALVTIFAVLGQGLKQSIIGSVTGEFRGDYVLSSINGITPTSDASAAALRRSGVATTVADELSGQGLVLGSTARIAGIGPGLSNLLLLQWKQGSNSSMATLGTDGAILDSGFATSNHLTVGSRLTIETPAGRSARFTVKAIYIPPEAEQPLGSVSVSAASFAALYPHPKNLFSLIDTPGGVTAANTAALNRVLAAFPDAQVQTEQQFINAQESGITGEINFLYILLALSIVVSLFGIVNTLVLTVFERTRELGMLRAIGMTRRQTRRMIRHEATITALLGAALGIPVGLGLAALFDRVLKNVPFAVPWQTLVVFVIAAIVVGLIAAIFPARRASRLNILRALQYE